MGAGKSTVAKMLHKKIKGSALISLDSIKHIISDVEMGDSKYLRLASDIGAIISQEYLRRGVSVIVEKAFTKEEFLVQFLNAVTFRKKRLFVYQIDAPLEIRIKRIKNRYKLRGVKNPLTLKKINQNHSEFMAFRYKEARIFDSSKITTHKIMNQILKDIRGSRKV